MIRRAKLQLCNLSENKNAKDRLSELPDAILIHILSFLDTKYAVQTSSLSKRWINLWISVTNLNFNSSSFRKLNTFQRFIVNVLKRRDNSISLNGFAFDCRGILTFMCFEKAFNYTTINGVKHLKVCIGRMGFYNIPIFKISPVSLWSLDIKATRQSRDIQTQFCFAQLQSLSLDGIAFDGSDLFSKCTNLVELSAVNSDVNYSNKLIISAPQLERLNLSFCKFRSQISEMVLSLPKLILFNFKAPNPLVLQTDELVHLKNVTIDVDSDSAQWDIEKEKEYSRTAMNMMQKLHNAEYVSLSAPTLSFIPYIVACAINLITYKLTYAFLSKLLYVTTGPRENPPLPFGNLKRLKIIAGSVEQQFHERKETSKLNELHKRISLIVFKHLMNYVLRKSPQAEIIIDIGNSSANSWKGETPNLLEEQEFQPQQAN
ncbi:hypothetical protein LguiB_014125 [Lonicera macranthoides]